MPAPPATPDRGAEGLPQPTAGMREAILEAVHSGRLDDLRLALELNELQPAIGDAAIGEPLTRLRELSRDGEGRDILAILGVVLRLPWAAVPLGADLENNRIFVWPGAAEAGTGALTEADLARLEAVLPADAAAAMRTSGVYRSWRLGIGADGTWHFLRTETPPEPQGGTPAAPSSPPAATTPAPPR